MTIIAYLGPEGTHSHKAAKKIASMENLRAYPSIALLTKALEEGEVTSAILPLENSLEGTVSATVDYLTVSTKKICAEIITDIEHVLAAKNPLLLYEVKTIASHPQALAQCSQFINELSVPTLPTASTVGAIEETKRNPYLAVIVSPLAAKIYNLHIIKKAIADAKNNTTRFCLLADKETLPTGNDKTSILFEIEDRPGSLYEILRLFAQANINLTKIESRPAKYRLGKYLFLIDFEGHQLERPIADLLEKVKSNCIFLKVLGSYPIFEREKYCSV